MKVQIVSGQGIIKILSDGFAECLIIQKALTVNWPDCRGSIGEYYAISEHPAEKRDELTENINQVLINGTDSEILDAINNFLLLFENGIYEVSIGKIPNDTAIFYNSIPVRTFGIICEDEIFRGSFYPDFDRQEYFHTRPYNTLDKKRVEYYKQQIRAGLKPKIITYDKYHLIHNQINDSHSYVLDGHHKLEAYLSLGVDINVVFITKVEDSFAYEELFSSVEYALEPHEFRHMFLNNQHLDKLDFVNSPYLTSILDKQLSNGKLSVNVIEVMLAANKHHKDWVSVRLQKLEQNPDLYNGFRIYYFSTAYNYRAWRYRDIDTAADFYKWKKLLFDN